MEKWAERTAALGHTPSDDCWENFRPLRLSREEDYSDWLAFLLEEGPRRLLFEFLGLNARVIHAAREDATGDFRPDILLSLDAEHVSIEVKLWDQNLGKTFDCCAMLEARAPGRWTHFILLPEERCQEWEGLCETGEDARRVQVSARTWTDVAAALRRCILDAEGSVAWRSWTVAYCGAIEQQILGLPTHSELKVASYWMLGRAARLSEQLSGVLGAANGDER